MGAQQKAKEPVATMNALFAEVLYTEAFMGALLNDLSLVGRLRRVCVSGMASMEENEALRAAIQKKAFPQLKTNRTVQRMLKGLAGKNRRGNCRVCGCRTYSFVGPFLSNKRHHQCGQCTKQGRSGYFCTISRKGLRTACRLQRRNLPTRFPDVVYKTHEGKLYYYLSAAAEEYQFSKAIVHGQLRDGLVCN